MARSRPSRRGVEGVDAVFAVHCDPSLDVGQVGLREGPITAACDHLRVPLSGRGGHTSRPQLTEDLTYALAKVVTDVPAALSRRLDPRAGAALVWGTIDAGAASNVIPSTGECSGTLRMLDANAWLSVGPLLDEIVHGVVAPYGVEARVERVKGVPPGGQHADGIDALPHRVAGTGMPTRADVAVARAVRTSPGTSRTAPGAMARLGHADAGRPTFDLHQGDLVVDEDAIGSAPACSPRSLVAHTDATRRALDPLETA